MACTNHSMLQKMLEMFQYIPIGRNQEFFSSPFSWMELSFNSNTLSFRGLSVGRLRFCFTYIHEMSFLSRTFWCSCVPREFSVRSLLCGASQSYSGRREMKIQVLRITITHFFSQENSTVFSSWERVFPSELLLLMLSVGRAAGSAWAGPRAGQLAWAKVHSQLFSPSVQYCMINWSI